MAPQDTFFDDEDDTWWVLKLHILRRGSPHANYWDSPLCIEEFDLSDRNFRPCPCGYQVRTQPTISPGDQ
jgi:CCR4-NOT transcription complex subunit 4